MSELITMEEAAEILGIAYVTISLRRSRFPDDDPFIKSIFRNRRALVAAEKDQVLVWNKLFVKGRRHSIDREFVVTVSLSDEENSSLLRLVESSGKNKSDIIRHLLLLAGSTLG